MFHRLLTLFGDRLRLETAQGCGAQEAGLITTESLISTAPLCRNYEMSKKSGLIELTDAEKPECGETTTDMAASIKAPTITIIKNPNVGGLPDYLSIAHRQLEKTQPAPDRHLGTSLESFQVAVDVLRLVCPESEVNEIDSLELTYRKAN